MVAQEVLDFAPDDPRPTLHLTNWSSTKLHGPGRRYTIMAKPRDWERGEGNVSVLTPEVEWLNDLQEHWITPRAYRELFEAMIREDDPGYAALRPGILYFVHPLTGDEGGKVQDGDSLLCACRRGKFKGQAECHRAWAAPLLVRAGWRVILDGAEVGT